MTWGVVMLGNRPLLSTNKLSERDFHLNLYINIKKALFGSIKLIINGHHPSPLFFFQVSKTFYS